MPGARPLGNPVIRPALVFLLLIFPAPLHKTTCLWKLAPHWRKICQTVSAALSVVLHRTFAHVTLDRHTWHVTLHWCAILRVAFTFTVRPHVAPKPGTRGHTNARTPSANNKHTMGSGNLRALQTCFRGNVRSGAHALETTCLVFDLALTSMAWLVP